MQVFQRIMLKSRHQFVLDKCTMYKLPPTEGCRQIALSVCLSVNSLRFDAISRQPFNEVVFWRPCLLGCVTRQTGHIIICVSTSRCKNKCLHGSVSNYSVSRHVNLQCYNDIYIRLCYHTVVCRHNFTIML